MSAWQSHEKDCQCVGCDTERAYMDLISEPMPSSPSTGHQIVSYIKEAIVWVAVIAVVLLMVRCGQ